MANIKNPLYCMANIKPLYTAISINVIEKSIKLEPRLQGGMGNLSIN